MTIGYVLDDTLDRSDGVQQAVLAIGERMSALGHEVHYIVPYTKRTDISNIHSVARTISLRFNGNSIRTPIWSSKKRIKSLFSEVKFEVLHVQMPYSPFMAARVIMSAPRETRIVGTFHILPYGWMSKYGTKLLGISLRRSQRRISKAFAVSPPALKFMKDDFGMSGEVLGNPVDYSFFHSFAENKGDKTKLRIVFVGRFEERKGVRQLIRAYEAMEQRKNVELVMCGKGPLWDGIKSYALQNGLNAVLTGFVTEEEKARYLASADIAVFPSTSGESFGIVLIEAMSSGAGVTIGGNNPGYTSVLGGWPDTLFNPNDIKAFALKLDKLIKAKDLAKKIGKSQHESVKLYDITRICERLEDAYEV